MRLQIVMAFVLLIGAATAQADGVVINARRVHISSAQQDADTMARTGILRHCGTAGGTAGGRREGIGFSAAGPDQAFRNCCFFGRYRIVEQAVARGPRGWFAVIRYE
jgi:6-phosphogluconate dehydrogenase (decarboxylating)